MGIRLLLRLSGRDRLLRSDDTRRAVLGQAGDAVGVGAGPLGRLRVAGICELRHALEHDRIGAWRQLRVGGDLHLAIGSLLVDLQLGDFELGRQPGGGERDRPLGTRTMGHIDRHLELLSRLRLPQFLFLRCHRNRRRVDGHRQRNVGRLPHHERSVGIIDIPDERRDAGRGVEIPLANAATAKHAERPSEWRRAIGRREHQHAAIAAGRNDSRRGGHSRRQALRLERDIAREAAEPDNEHVDHHPSTERERGHRTLELVGIGAVCLRQWHDQSEPGVGPPRLEHPCAVDPAAGVGGEFADEQPVSAVGRRLERDRRVEAWAVEDASLKFRRTVVGKGHFLRGDGPVGGGREALYEQRRVSGQAEPPRVKIKDPLLPRLRVEAKPVAVAPRVEATGNDIRQRDRLGPRRIVVRLLLDRHLLRRCQHRRRHDRRPRHAAGDVEQISREVADGKQPTRESAAGVARGVVDIDVDRRLFEPVVPRLPGADQPTSDGGEPRGLASCGDRREDALHGRPGGDEQAVGHHLAAAHIHVVHPHDMAARHTGHEVETGIVVVAPSRAGEHAATRVEHVERRRQPRIDPTGPDVEPHPLARGQREGVVVGDVNGDHARDRCIERYIRRRRQPANAIPRRDLRDGSHHEQPRVRDTEATRGHDIVETGRHIRSDLDRHLASHRLRLRIELRGTRQHGLGDDPGMREPQRSQVVEVGAHDRRLDCRAALAAGRQDRVELGPRKLGPRDRHGHQQRDAGEAERESCLRKLHGLRPSRHGIRPARRVACQWVNRNSFVFRIDQITSSQAAGRLASCDVR